MKQIILDTETTGIGYEKGHRIIEIGCIELVDRKFTGNHYHVYLNPQRLVDDGAFRVHGMNYEFLKDKPLFKDIVEDFIQFIDGAELVIHNATFDVGFLNSELKKVKWPTSIQDHCRILDTLALAKAKHPGQRNNLDALCKRYDVNNSNRALHGALLDADLLGWVYLAMTGGQGVLTLDDEFDLAGDTNQHAQDTPLQLLTCHTPVLKAEPDEIARHASFVQDLVKKSGNNYW